MSWTDTGLSDTQSVTGVWRLEDAGHWRCEVEAFCACVCVKVEISLLGSSRKEKSAERKFTKRKEMADAKLQHRLSDILMPGAGVA